jgi:hypothetical protein
MRSFIICTFTKYYYDDQFKKYEIGGLCSTHGRNENIYKLLLGSREGKKLLGRLWLTLQVNTWKCALKKYWVRLWTELNWLRIGSCNCYE